MADFSRPRAETSGIRFLKPLFPQSASHGCDKINAIHRADRPVRRPLAAVAYCRTDAEVTQLQRRLSYKQPREWRPLMLLVPAAFMLGLGWYKTAGLLLLVALLRRPVLGVLYDNLLAD